MRSWNKVQASQAQLFARRLRHEEVAQMDRIKRAAEQSESLHVS
jgi:hypothetical protein